MTYLQGVTVTTSYRMTKDSHETGFLAAVVILKVNNK